MTTAEFVIQGAFSSKALIADRSGVFRSGSAEHRPPARRSLRALAAAAFAVFFLTASPNAARAQATEAGIRGGVVLSAGGTITGYKLQYGQRKLLGFSGFLDADTTRRFGLIAEGSWLFWHQSANVHLSTFSGGARYHFDVGRFQPYAKGLLGEGYFNFPYNYATGHYMVITAGGGLDYQLTRRIYVRAVDFEYQDWPQFTYGQMSNFSASAGIRVRFHGGR